MQYAFNAAEVFDVAIQIELNGVAFYRKAAQYASDEAFRKELLDLGEMEQEHVARFTELKRDLIGEHGDAEWFDPDGEAARYLEAFAAGNVFNVTDDASKALTEQPSARDILNFAIERERDSIMFYVGIKELVPKKLGRDKIEAIIKEEMGHIVLLNRKLRRL